MEIKLRKLIAETVLIDSIDVISQELAAIKESLNARMILEGVDDPGILKCVFLAGGPGSGKGRSSSEIFGIDKQLKKSLTSFTSSGLKVVNSDSAYEAQLKKNGIDPKELANIEKNDPELWDVISGDNNPNSFRNKAKDITAKQKAFFEDGGLGMIIDGTGHKFSKIDTMKKELEKKGYDTFMIFVDTSLDVALKRNYNRGLTGGRRLSDDLVSTSWKAVQDNLSAYKRLFGGSFEIVDNTEDNKKYDYEYTNKHTGVMKIVERPIKPMVRAAADRFINQPIQNKNGKTWITAQRALKKARLI